MTLTLAEALSLIIGSVALVISGVLLVIRILEWRAKPELTVGMDWTRATHEPSVLRLIVHNRGRAPGIVRDVRLSAVTDPDSDPDRDQSFHPYYIAEGLPALVPPGGFAPFRVKIDPKNNTSALTRLLLDGTLRYVILVDQDGARLPFAIPAVPPETPNRRSTYGRVSKR